MPHVLIVDDDAGTREALSAIIGEDGLTTATAGEIGAAEGDLVSASTDRGEITLPRFDRHRATVGGAGGHVRLRSGEQHRVTVVHDPVLWSGQSRGEPATHRAGTAAKITDHRTLGTGEPALYRLDQIRRAGLGVGR